MKIAKIKSYLLWIPISERMVLGDTNIRLDDLKEAIEDIQDALVEAVTTRAAIIDEMRELRK